MISICGTGSPVFIVFGSMAGDDVRVRLCQQQIVKLDLEIKAAIQVISARLFIRRELCQLVFYVENVPMVFELF